MTILVRFSRVRAAALGLVVFLAALAGVQSPAKADLGDCVNALAPIGVASKLSEMAGKVSACGSEAASNPMMAVVMAVMITLRAEGLFGGSDECNAMVDGVAGKLIGAGLKAIGIDGGDIQALILGQIKLSSIPGIGDTLMHFTSCGCAVAGALDDAKAIAQEYIGSVNGCGEFAGEAMGAIASGVFNSGWFSHGAASPGFIDQPPAQCPAGFLGKTPFHNQCVNNNDGTMTCSWDNVSYNPTSLPPPVYNGQTVPCYCDGGATAVSVGPAMICKCPGGQGYNADGTCKPCAAGQALGDDGQCRAGQPNEVNNLGSWLDCGKTQVAYKDGTKQFCGPKCDPGSTMDMANSGLPKCIALCGPNSVFDAVGQKCKGCTALDQVAVFDDKVGKFSSAGQCKPCNDGYKINFDNKDHPTCKPACGEGFVLDAKGACVDCNKQGKIAVSAAGKGSRGSCEFCKTPLEKRDGNSCIPSKDCQSWQTLEVKFGGIGVAGGGTVCVNRCGPGELYKPAVVGGTNVLHLLDGKTMTITTLSKPETCTPCGDKEVLDAANNYCGPCPAGQVWHAAAGGKPSYCQPAPRVQPVAVPPPNVRPVEPPKTIPDAVKPAPEVVRPAPTPAAECPPGRVRNAAGNCVILLDTDDFSRGGSSPSGRPVGPGGGGTVTPLPPQRAPAPAPGGRP